MHIVLVEPEIPGNTGNIARLCAATGSELHLVRPLGFSTDDRYLKRAGLDYWHLVRVTYHDDYRSVEKSLSGHNLYFNTTKAKKFYSDITFQADDVLIFGKETAGLPEELLAANAENCIRLPMLGQARSLNLSNAVAIVLYEALSQLGFPNLC